MLIIAVALTLSQLIIVFLIFHKELHNNIKKGEANDLLTLRLNSLKHEAALINKDIKTTRILRHDLRHHYRMLYALLKDEDTAAALEHIEKQEEIIREMKH
ncbi:MAG: hypothetical protein IJ712_00340 [Anaerovibrio sp.]|nr:hypothetical protein [Anaerovibrio sp.]MBR1696663.1 hypothetical protein [Anaerovibrio sp.]